jgi:hypothetical protein
VSGFKALRALQAKSLNDRIASLAAIGAFRSSRQSAQFASCKLL